MVRGAARPSTSPADFPSWQCGQDGKQLHPGPCDLQAVSQRFEAGHYTSVVSGTLRNRWVPGGEGWGRGGVDPDKPPYSTASWRTWWAY